MVVCHFGHENDVICTENIFEFLKARDIAYDFINLSQANVARELRQCLACGPQVSLFGFNSQLDHAWVGDEPLLLAAARHGVTAIQWVLDHPSGRWPEFNYSDPRTSRFLFHSHYSQSYFTKYCCPGAPTAAAGSIGPNRRSRSDEEGLTAFAARPVDCLIALGLNRLGRTSVEVQTEVDGLDEAVGHSVRNAISRARFELDQPLETHLSAALDEGGIVLGRRAFNRCFRLVNDSVQYLRRAQIIKTASQFGVHIQSEEATRSLIEGGRAKFRSNVGTPETLASMPHCKAVLSVSPVNDSIHDRTCNALNAGCLLILEDNRAHRGLFVHGENALLFRYDDNSLSECLARVFGGPRHIYPIAAAARTLRDAAPFRFGSFPNILDLAGAAGPARSR